jgi:hypothetical protein
MILLGFLMLVVAPKILWIVHTMRDYGETYKSVPLMCDISSDICLAQNPVFHGRAKHIKVRHHFLRDHVEKGDIEMRYIVADRQLAFALYILYLICIALHFIHIYLIYLLLHLLC